MRKAKEDSRPQLTDAKARAFEDDPVQKKTGRGEATKATVRERAALADAVTASAKTLLLRPPHAAAATARAAHRHFCFVSHRKKRQHSHGITLTYNGRRARRLIQYLPPSQREKDARASE
ncbi:hypothetical protein MRX96_056019 [Rhipicephalus microplus]